MKHFRTWMVLGGVWIASTTAQAAPEFRYRINEDLGTLDWGYGEVAWPVVLQVMEGLTSLGPRATAEAAVAQSWRWLDRAQTQMEFELRKDARWSDGKPVCAQQFVDAWLRVRSKSVHSPFVHLLEPLADGARLARARGCHKLIVQLKTPTPWLPELLSHWVFFPVRKDLLALHGRDWFQAGRLVSNGPYVLKEWKLNQEYVLAPNARFRDAQAAVRPMLRARVVGDDSTALSLFETGGLDWIKDLPTTEKPRLRDRPEYRESPSLVEYHLGFGNDVDRPARCALSRALDRRAIPEILRGGEMPAQGAVPEVLLPHSRNLLPFDAAGAQELWKRSEFGKKAGKTATPLLVHYYAKDIHTPLMEWIQGQWSKVLGLKVHLVRTDGKTYWGQLAQTAPEVFLSGTTANYPHPQAFLQELLPDSRANFGHYRSPEFARRLTQGRVNAAEQQLIEEDCGIAPLYFRTTATLVSRKWTGWAMNPMGFVYLKDLRADK